jgi:hypothetical protein
MQTEIFICEQCNVRKRLVRSERHWCDLCTAGSPVELRTTREAKAYGIRKEALDSPNASAVQSLKLLRPKQLVGLGVFPNQSLP